MIRLAELISLKRHNFERMAKYFLCLYFVTIAQLKIKYAPDLRSGLAEQTKGIYDA
jgi:hypothetical protein